jgi:transglutaminase-like putative cysteine protease
MRPFRPAVCFFLILFSSALAQNKNAHIDKPSPWITTTTFDLKAEAPQGQASSFYYLLVDEQENAITQERYYHYVYKILTSEGVQEMSDLTFDFDPAYQELTIHKINVIRGSEQLNKLPSTFSTIQKEESMDRYLYDGTNTAVINLKDIRKGDVIEYSFTRKGYNPVFAGHFSRTMYFDYNVASEKGFQRLLLPSSTKPTFKFFNGEVAYSTEHIGTATAYTWNLDHVKSYQYEKNTPGWFEGERSVNITDFTSWAEVAKWASQLFTLTESEKKKITNEILPNFSKSDPEKFTLEAIRFVQDDIRYLGFESGLNSHKPHSPVEVYNQRFGDCKDKSFLLSSLLNARGIEAYPILVSTVYGDKLSEKNPSSMYFNHCVVKIILNSKTLYIDPTISNQGGKLFSVCFPDYKRALVVTSGTTDLEILPTPASSSTTEEQTVDIEKIDSNATLSVVTTYTGTEADYQRSEFQRNNLETVQKNYLNYYANLYPEIKSLADIKVTDDREVNEVTVEEKYNIPNFWKQTEEDGVILCEVSAQTLNNYFDVSKSTLQRKAPYALTYPINYYHNTHINVPEDWSVNPVKQNISSSFYDFDYEVQLNDRKISRYFHYKTKSDHIPETSLKKFVNDHEKMSNVVTYQLTYNKNVVRNSDNKNYIGLLVTLFALGAGGWMVFVLYRKFNPIPHYHYSEGTPIGGVLYLMALAVIGTPIRLLVAVASDSDFYLNGTWTIWLDTEQYGVFIFGLLSHIYNLVKLLFAILLAVLFFERRSAFPILMSVQIASSVIFLGADTLVNYYINPTSVEYKTIIQTIISAVVWLPYLYISTRVKETFVNQSEFGDHERYRNAEPN